MDKDVGGVRFSAYSVLVCLGHSFSFPFLSITLISQIKLLYVSTPVAMRVKNTSSSISLINDT